MSRTGAMQAEPLDGGVAYGATRSAAHERVARALAGAAALLAIAVVALLARLESLPFQDVPNHLSRAVAIADLWFDGGARFGRLFEFEWQFVPYVLGDVWHALTLAVLPPDVAARLWMVVAFACLPAALVLLLRTWRCSAFVVAGGALFAGVLASDWFLLLGFLNFRYGLALALCGVAAWERVLERPSAGRYALYALAIVGAYLMHLAAVLFLVAIVGTLSVVRLWRARAHAPDPPRAAPRFALLVQAGLPPLAMLAWHLAFRGGKEVGESVQPDLVSKLLRVVAPLVPFKTPGEIVITLAFAALLALPILRSRPRGWPPRAVETAALAVAFLALYVVLPEVKGAVWGVDVRALPFAWLFLAVTALFVLEARGHDRRRFALIAVAIATVHVAALWPVLVAQNEVNRALRAVAEQVPVGARLLPVVTRPRAGILSPSAHVASFATIRRAALVPYTFTGDGAPMPYFRFRQRPPPYPFQWWYLDRKPPASWGGLFDGWDYLLVQLPLDWNRLPVRGTPVAGNARVVLLDLRAARESAPRSAAAGAVPARISHPVVP